MHTRTSLLISYLFIAVFVGSCKKNDDFKDTFKIVKIDLEEEAYLHDKLTATYYDVFYGSYIRFYPNDSVFLVNDEGYSYFGKWRKNENDNTLTLDFQPIGSATFTIDKTKTEETTERWLLLKSVSKSAVNARLALKKDTYYQSSENDLMLYENNWWRKKPNKRESEKEIKQRVVAQLDYMINYFGLIHENNYGSFHVGQFVSPFRYYANGIGLENLETNTKWQQLFYDTQDAQKAYKLLEDGLKSMSSYPADSKYYTKGYINALKQIKEYILL